MSSQAINSNYIFCCSSAATYFLCGQEPALLFNISHHVTEEPAIPPSACPASASPAWIWQRVPTGSCSQHYLAPLILAYWSPMGKVPTTHTCSHLKKKNKSRGIQTAKLPMEALPVLLVAELGTEIAGGWIRWISLRNNR